MKRWVLLIMLAAALLAGCTIDGSPETSTDNTVQTTAPDPGLYVPDSDIQKQTNGAVREFALQHKGFCALDFMGEDAVLFYEMENGVLVNRLTGENCAVASGGALPIGIYPNDASVRIEGRTLAYYNGPQNSVIYYNDRMQETGRKQLPQEITGLPVLGSDLYSAYYCVDRAVYAADLRTGISRLIRQYDTESPKVVRTLFNDSTLVCEVTSPGGSREFVFISTENGMSLGADSGLDRIVCHSSSYLLSRHDGTVAEILFGTKGEATQLLAPKEAGKAYPVITMNGVVVESSLEDGTGFTFYDLSTGKRTSQIVLGSLGQVKTVEADDNGAYVWIVASDNTGNDRLLRWDLSLSTVEDSKVYTGQRYTLQNPDKEGLKQCQALADDISKRYGVDVLLVDGIKEPDGCTIRYEYQVKAIQEGLEVLDTVLAQFPEGFFTAMSSISQNKPIHIGLIRGITGQTQYGAAEPQGLQYWLDGEAYVALILGGDFEKTVIHGISHVLDSYIYANSILYDEWYEVNPKGFRYDGNYTDYLDRTDSPYLSGNKRNFIDSYSMSFAKEDRARILEYALTAGNETHFGVSAMQNKLLRVCRAIRDAYDWKKDTRDFPWEQYLSKSIAYVPKKK